VGREHGTRAMYTFGKCRCEDCRRANCEYQKRRSRLRGYGLPAQVDAAPVREHVRALMSSPYRGAHDGIGWRRIADLAGVHRSVIRQLVWGKRGKPTQRIKRENAERLLAVGPDELADAAVVWAANTWRYVNELIDFGIPKVRIARALGQQGQGLQLGRRYVTVRNARAVEDLHWKVFKASPAFRRACGCPMPDHVAAWLDEAEGRAARLKRAGVR
jgi:hypothetical protein